MERTYLVRLTVEQFKAAMQAGARQDTARHRVYFDGEAPAEWGEFVDPEQPDDIRAAAIGAYLDELPKLVRVLERFGQGPADRMAWAKRIRKGVEAGRIEGDSYRARLADSALRTARDADR